VFGPYVSGVTAGEAVVTLSGVTVLMAGLPVLLGARGLTPLGLGGLWAMIIVVAVASTIWRPFDPGFYGSLPASHSLGLLVMVLAVTWCWVELVPAERLILVVARVTAWGMAVNAVIAMVQLRSSTAILPGLPRVAECRDSDRADTSTRVPRRTAGRVEDLTSSLTITETGSDDILSGSIRLNIGVSAGSQLGLRPGGRREHRRVGRRPALQSRLE
jgi:hypothetical protein